MDRFEHTKVPMRGRAPRLVAAVLAASAISLSFAELNVAGAATTRTSSVVITTAKNARLGTILVSGKTLYTLVPSKVACAAACLKIWPAVDLPKGVTKAIAGKGVSAAKLGTIKRAGGVLQVTYAGKALYWFSGDRVAGQIHGNVTDTWGKWHADVVIAKSGSTSASGSGSGGGTNSGTGGVAF